MKAARTRKRRKPRRARARPVVVRGDVLRVEPAGLFHGVLCDPPYELGFMGKGWDKSGVAFQPETWARIASWCLPGAWLLAFGGTRTFHRLACAIEDAGWEIRDTLMWVYGSGFPKSLDVSKAIDKAAGVRTSDNALLRYLATLILPPEHVASRLLVPFAGSGSEMIGAYQAGWEEVVGIELDAEYWRIARCRIAHWCGKVGVRMGRGTLPPQAGKNGLKKHPQNAPRPRV